MATKASSTPTAGTEHSPTLKGAGRRHLAATPVTLPAAAPATTESGSPNPDAGLIAIAQRFIRNELVIQTTDVLPAGDVDMDEVARLSDISYDLAIAMSGVRAVTAEGILARAQCDDAFSMEGSETTAGRLATDVMRDARALLKVEEEMAGVRCGT